MNSWPRKHPRRDRETVYLPLLTLLSGLGTFGTNKTQGLFAGVEYLENEASSSQLDMTNQWERLEKQMPGDCLFSGLCG